MLRQIYNKPVSLADIGINAERSAKIHSTVTDLSPNISEKDDRRKKLEVQVAELEASECVSKTVTMVQERRKAELTLQKEMTLSGHLTQITAGLSSSRSISSHIEQDFSGNVSVIIT